jgi:integrase
MSGLRDNEVESPSERIEVALSRLPSRGTGQRRCEVAGIPWSEIDLAEKSWNIPGKRTKNGKAHFVPLSKQAIDVLAAAPKFDGDYIFKGRRSGPVVDFGGPKKRLDVLLPQDMPHWTWHDLRRTLSTGLARLEIPPHVIDAAINHTSGKISGVAAVYNRYSYAAEKREAMDKWGAYVEKLVNGGNTSPRPIAGPDVTGLEPRDEDVSDEFKAGYADDIAMIA